MFHFELKETIYWSSLHPYIYSHLTGDGLASLSVKEMKQLETRLERGIARIRAKKVKKLHTYACFIDLILLIWLKNIVYLYSMNSYLLKLRACRKGYTFLLSITNFV